jgi:hypothetical protein
MPTGPITIIPVEDSERLHVELCNAYVAEDIGRVIEVLGVLSFRDETAENQDALLILSTMAFNVLPYRSIRVYDRAYHTHVMLLQTLGCSRELIEEFCFNVNAPVYHEWI